MTGIAEERPLGPREQASEAMLMGLRLAEGVDLTDIAARSGFTARPLVDDAAVAQLAGLGFVTRVGNRLTVTEAGMPLLDAILPRVVLC